MMRLSSSSSQEASYCEGDNYKLRHYCFNGHHINGAFGDISVCNGHMAYMAHIPIISSNSVVIPEENRKYQVR